MKSSIAVAIEKGGLGGSRNSCRLMEEMGQHIQKMGGGGGSRCGTYDFAMPQVIALGIARFSGSLHTLVNERE